MNFWSVKWPKKAHHAESQNNVIFDVLIFSFFFTVGRNRALPSKTALRRDWETGFCVATAFFVKRIQRIRNCGWSSANTVVSWQRFVIYCRSVFTLAITTRKCLFPFFREFFKTVVFRLYFYAWFSRNRADRLESLEFLEKIWTIRTPRVTNINFLLTISTHY